MGDGPGRTCVTRPGPRTAHTMKSTVLHIVQEPCVVSTRLLYNMQPGGLYGTEGNPHTVGGGLLIFRLTTNTLYID